MTDPVTFQSDDFPIVKVTAYEDRSEVVRRGRVSLGAGRNRVVLQGLSALVDATRTKAQGQGIDVFLENVQLAPFVRATRPADDEAREQQRRDRDRQAFEVKVLQQQLEDKTNARAHALTTLQQALTRLGECLFVEALDEAAMGKLVESLQADLRRRDDQLAALRDRIREQLTALEALEAQSRPTEKPRGTFTDLEFTLWSDTAQEGELLVTYVIPCAVWRPRHTAQLVGTTLTWTAQATVWQRTGEDWHDVELVLSTARPSQGAALPQLHEDRLRYRVKTREERKTVRVQHRFAAAQKDAAPDVAPGVYDGGEPRDFTVPERVTIKSHGRPVPVTIDEQSAACVPRRLARPTLSSLVFVFADTQNPFAFPLLAGPVTLSLDGNYMGVGDIPYVGAHESFSLPFGSDDRFHIALHRERIHEKRTLGKDRDHFVQRAEVVYDGEEPLLVDVQLMVPVSEIDALRIKTSEAHSSGAWTADDNGHVTVQCDLGPGDRRTVEVGFYFDAGSDVQIPNPW